MNPAVPSRAGRREWIGLGVIALPCLLYSMDLTVLNLAVPHLSADLRPSAAQLLWIVDIYGFVLAGFLIPMGALGDRIGRRRLLLIGAAAFGLASVLAAFSRTAPMLIAARALLGVAGATLAPSTLSLIRNMFADPAQRTVAIGVWITSYSAGGAIGPLIGGFLLAHYWWGSVFLIGVPVMLLLLLVGPALLPEFRDPHARRIDLLSASQSLGAVLLVIYGIKQFAQGGASLWAAITIACGLLLTVFFVRRQRMLADPVVDLALFKLPAFSTALAAYTIGTFVVFGSSFFIAQYLQLVRGLSPLQAGFLMLPFFVGFIIGSMVVPRITPRMSTTKLMAGGLVMSAIGFLIVTWADARFGLVALAIAALVYSLGLAPVFTLSTDLIVGAAPPERAGSAAALSETGSELGGALGIAVLGSVGTLVYRHAMPRLVPGDLSVAAQETVRGTLGGAVAIAEGMPANFALELLSSARQAFDRSLDAAAFICAALAVAMAFAMLLARPRAT